MTPAARDFVSSERTSTREAYAVNIITAYGHYIVRQPNLIEYIIRQRHRQHDLPSVFILFYNCFFFFRIRAWPRVQVYTVTTVGKIKIFFLFI